MPGGLSWQVTHWICARCSNSVRLRTNLHRRNSTLHFLSSSSHSRPNSILATPPVEGNSTSSKKALNEGDKRTRGPVPIRRRPDTKNIFIDDLAATLEAHRVANKARLIRRVECDIEGIVGQMHLKVPRIRTDQSAGPEQRVETFEGLAQRSNHTDSSQNPDPPASVSEDESAEAEVPGGSISTSMEAERSVFTVRPGGAWYCSWKDTRSDKYGALQQPWKDFIWVKEVDPTLR